MRSTRSSTTSERDILRWLARQPLATAAQLRARFSITDGIARARLNALIDHGFVTYEHVLQGAEGVYRVTQRGLKLANFPTRQLKLDLHGFDHDLAVVWLSIELEQEFGPDRLLTGRELRAREYSSSGGHFALEVANGVHRHFPSLAVEGRAGEQPLFVELAAPARGRRVDSLLWAYVAARHVGGVRLYTRTEAAERTLRKALVRVDPPAGRIELRRYTPRPAITTDNATPVAPASSGARLSGRGAVSLLTARDREIIRWVGRQQVATATQIWGHFGLSGYNGYTRLRALVEQGLLVHDRVGWREPGVYRATQGALVLSDLPLRPSRIDLLRYRHSLDLTTLCLELEREFGVDRVVTERELRHRESCFSEPRFAATLDRREQRHFPDLAVEHYDGERPLAVELERSLKSKAQLEAIVGAYAGSRHIAAVRYYASTAEVERSLRAAVARVGAPGAIFDIRLGLRRGVSARGTAAAAKARA